MMVGAVVGVGVFGLPYAFAQSGYAIGLLTLLLVGGMFLFLNLMLSEVALQTPGHRRFIGYVERYLGKRWKNVTAVLFIAYAFGAMAAFMILGGSFLHALLGPIFGGDAFWYQLAIVVLPGVFTWQGVRELAKIELVVVTVLLMLFVAVVLALAPSVHIENLMRLDPDYWFVPYGVVFFALSGFGAIPEMKDVLGRQSRRLPQTVVIGLSAVVTLYALFSLAVVGVSGEATTPEAMAGLAPALGASVATIGALIGFVSVSSIFSVLSVEMQSTLRFDFHVALRRAWFLTLGIPIVVFLFGAREFIELIGFLGAVFGGFLGIILVMLYERLRMSGACRAAPCLNLPRPLSGLLIGIFAAGIVLTFFGLV